MAGTSITVTGLREAQQMLAGLASEVQAKILRKALREAAMPIVTAAMENAPVKTGKLMYNLGALPARNLDANTISVPIGPAGGWFHGKVFYAGMQEWGFTTGVKHNKNARGPKRLRMVGGDLAWMQGRRPNRTPKQMKEAYASASYKAGKFFMTRAFDERAEESGALFVWNLRDGVDRYVGSQTRAAARTAKGSA